MGLELILPLILSLVGTGYSIYGDSQAQKEADKERIKLETRQKQRLNDLNAWFNKEYNTPLLGTEVAKSFLGQLNVNQREALEGLESNAVAQGATPEAKVATQKMLQDQYAKGLAEMVQYGDARKQGIRKDYMWQLNNLNAPIDQMSLAKMQGWQDWSTGTSNAAGNLALASANVDWETLLGGGSTPGTGTKD